MNCPHCGELIAEQAEICPKCGVRVKSIEDKPSIPVNLITFCCIPILGIIMFFVWKDDKPKAAKWALIWAIISIVFWFIVSFLFGLLAAILEAVAY